MSPIQLYHRRSYYQLSKFKMFSEGNTDDFHTFIIEMFCILFLIEMEPKLRGFVEQVMRALVLNAVS